MFDVLVESAGDLSINENNKNIYRKLYSRSQTGHYGEWDKCYIESVAGMHRGQMFWQVCGANCFLHILWILCLVTTRSYKKWRCRKCLDALKGYDAGQILEKCGYNYKSNACLWISYMLQLTAIEYWIEWTRCMQVTAGCFWQMPHSDIHILLGDL